MKSFSFKNYIKQFKEKIIHQLGGITLKEVPHIEKKIDIIKTEKPIIPIAINKIYYYNEYIPEKIWEEELAADLAKEIIKLHLYSSETERLNFNRNITHMKIQIVKP